MQRGYLITIFLLIIALIFAIQNTSTMMINFLVWSFGGSQALISVLILLLGFISGWILGLTKVWKKNQHIKTLNKKITSLGSEPPVPKK